MLDVLPWRINTGANKAGHTHSGDGSLCQTSNAVLAASGNFCRGCSRRLVGLAVANGPSLANIFTP